MLVTAILLLLLPVWASSTASVHCGTRLLMFDDFDSLHLLAWRGEPGGNTTVLLEPTYPWEADVHSEGTVLYDSIAAECRDPRPPCASFPAGNLEAGGRHTEDGWPFN